MHPCNTFILGALTGLYAASCFGAVIVVPESGPQLARNQLCVATAVKVGDSFTNVDGDRLVIHSVSGKLASHFSPCANQDQPILAEVELIESPEFHSTFSLDLPEGYSRRVLSSREQFELFRVRAESTAHHVTLSVLSRDHRKVPDVEAFVDRIKRAQTGPDGTTQTATEHLTIDGLPALRWQTEYKGHFLAPSMFSVTTVIIGDAEVAVVTAEGIARQVKAFHDEMAELANSAHGLRKEPVASAPPLQ